MFFLQWVMTYCNVQKNLMGKDRVEAMRVMDDDEAFDKWIVKYEKERQKKDQEMDTGSRPTTKPGRKVVDKETFLKATGGIIRGPAWAVEDDG